MVVIVVVGAIAGCCVLALADRRDLPPPDSANPRWLTVRLDAFCVRLNRLLLTMAVALAVTVTALSSGQGARWEARAIGHPEWFGASADAESVIDISDPGAAAVEVQCRTWIYTCRCMRGLPHPRGVTISPNCAAAGQ
jgi:hypothetical protein